MAQRTRQPVAKAATPPKADDPRAAAQRLVALIVSHPQMTNGHIGEWALPSLGISQVSYLGPDGPEQPTMSWYADGTRYVAGEAELRAMAAVFDAMADQCAEAAS